MTSLVVDASVAAKWFIDEAHFEAAGRLRNPQYRILAPDFMLLETDNVFCKRVRRGEFSLGEAQGARLRMRAMPVEFYGTSSLLDRAFEIAVETRTSVYDFLYAALAEALGVRMVTADRRFFERISATPFAGLVMWVEDIGRPEAPAKRRDAKGRRRKRR